MAEPALWAGLSWAGFQGTKGPGTDAGAPDPGKGSLEWVIEPSDHQARSALGSPRDVTALLRRSQL